MSAIQIGTRISGGPYNQSVGIVTRYESAADRSYIIGAGMERVSGYVDVVWETGESCGIPAGIVTSLPYRVHEGLASAEDIALLRAKAAAYKASEAAKADEAVRARVELRAKLLAEFSHLSRPEAVKGGALVCAAKNIRAELVRAYPGVKFGVRTQRYSGGNNLTVSWVDGPTSGQVDAIIGKYAGGHFDGMTDSYEYSRSVWCELFGKAYYVSARRELSDRVVASVLGRVARQWGVALAPSVADYRAGKVHYIDAPNCSEFGREVSIAMSRHTCAIGKGEA